MSARWARAVLATYRWAGAAAYPFLGSYMASRAGRGRDERSRRRERYGYSRIPRPAGPLVWIHAAGEAETAAVISLVDTVLMHGIKVVLTTGTVSSAGLAAERLGDRVIHQFVPIDFKPAISRFLDHWQPDLAIMAESEMWPMRILELGQRRVPQVLVNGRMSDRAFASWSKRYNIAEALFENLSLVVAQSERDAERFQKLGARPVKISGNLKVDVVPPPCDRAELQRVLDSVANRACWAALRTMPGEEAAVADAHKRLKVRYPDLLSVVVPTDPQRGDEIAAALAESGLIVSRRGRGDAITPKTDILLGDTRGETGIYARLSEVAFVGGSLSACGGQNPLDSVLCGCAVLTGEDISYHREIYQPLIDGGGVKLVKDSNMLAGAVNYLLKNAAARRDMANAGQRAVGGMRGALARTVRELEPFIHPLIVKARLEEAGTARR